MKTHTIEDDINEAVKSGSRDNNKESKSNDSKQSESNINQTESTANNQTNTDNSKTKDKLITELTELVQRTQANFENFRKRMEKEQQDYKEFANSNILKQVLDIADNFELAFKNEQSPQDFKRGMELIFARLKTLLEKNNITEIEALGKKFDPRLHQAMMQSTDKTKEDNIIVEEFQKGYKIGERILRASMVKINKK